MLSRGGVVVQKGAMHAWRNLSERDWVRFFAVVQPTKPVELDRGKAGMEYRGVSDLRGCVCATRGAWSPIFLQTIRTCSIATR